MDEDLGFQIPKSTVPIFESSKSKSSSIDDLTKGNQFDEEGKGNDTLLACIEKLEKEDNIMNRCESCDLLNTASRYAWQSYICCFPAKDRNPKLCYLYSIPVVYNSAFEFALLKKNLSLKRISEMKRLHMPDLLHCDLEELMTQKEELRSLDSFYVSELKNLLVFYQNNDARNIKKMKREIVNCIKNFKWKLNENLSLSAILALIKETKREMESHLSNAPDEKVERSLKLKWANLLIMACIRALLYVKFLSLHVKSILKYGLAHNFMLFLIVTKRGYENLHDYIDSNIHKTLKKVTKTTNEPLIVQSYLQDMKQYVSTKFIISEY